MPLFGSCKPVKSWTARGWSAHVLLSSLIQSCIHTRTPRPLLCMMAQTTPDRHITQISLLFLFLTLKPSLSRSSLLDIHQNHGIRLNWRSYLGSFHIRSCQIRSDKVDQIDKSWWTNTGGNRALKYVKVSFGEKSGFRCVSPANHDKQGNYGNVRDICTPCMCVCVYVWRMVILRWCWIAGEVVVACPCPVPSRHNDMQE